MFEKAVTERPLNGLIFTKQLGGGGKNVEITSNVVHMRRARYFLFLFFKNNVVFKGPFEFVISKGVHDLKS
jgi:hypothetical protein